MIHPMIALLAVILILSTGFLILYKIFGLVEKDMADDEKNRDDDNGVELFMLMNLSPVIATYAFASTTFWCGAAMEAVSSFV